LQVSRAGTIAAQAYNPLIKTALLQPRCKLSQHRFCTANT
jgi:hypothetical protein